jgi:hypothetical protein
MWAHYGAQHWGAAVGLERRHPFFQEIGNLRRVEYDRQRVAVSSNGGLIRVAGHPIKNDDALPPVATILRKSLEWAYEKEWRLLASLARAHLSARARRSRANSSFASLSRDRYTRSPAGRQAQGRAGSPDRRAHSGGSAMATHHGLSRCP